MVSIACAIRWNSSWRVHTKTNQFSFFFSNNLLYPKVHQTTMTLHNACRTCPYSEEARNTMVYRNDLMSISKEQAGVIDQLMKDPTLPRSREHNCPNCGNNESVFFQDQSKRTFNRMILFFVCTNCNHLFRDEGIKIWRTAPLLFLVSNIRSHSFSTLVFLLKKNILNSIQEICTVLFVWDRCDAHISDEVMYRMNR